MIKLSIEVQKIDKALLKPGKDGKPRWLNVALFDRPSEKDDGFIVQEVSREQREAGVKGPIIGNWKDWSKGKTEKAASKPAANVQDDDDGSTIPF